MILHARIRFLMDLRDAIGMQLAKAGDPKYEGQASNDKFLAPIRKFLTAIDAEIDEVSSGEVDYD